MYNIKLYKLLDNVRPIYFLTILLFGFLLMSISSKAQPFAYITNQNSDDVTVIDTSTNNVVATISVGDGPYGVAIKPDGNFVYVSNQFSNNVSVIDTTTNTVIQNISTLPFTSNPKPISISPNGNLVYVGSPGEEITVIDTSTNTVVAQPNVVQGEPKDFAISPDSSLLYVADSSGFVRVVDTATNIIINSISVPATPNPKSIAITPNGNFVYVASDSEDISVIDTVTNTVVATANIIGGPEDLVITPDGNFVYVTEVQTFVRVIDTSTNNLVATINVGNLDALKGISVTPDGNFVYFAKPDLDMVSVIQTSTNTVVDNVNVGDFPLAFGNFIGPSPDSTAVTFLCVGFESPMDKGPVKVKKNRVLPFKATLQDELGNPITDVDVISPPVIQVLFTSNISNSVDVTGDALPAGQGTEGNQFEFGIDKWQFNLKTKNYTAAGTYTVSMVSGDTSEYIIDPACVGIFVIE